MKERGKKALGAVGEDLACRYLESRGHRILERNWRGGHLEVDIISAASDGVHFVEVKTRTAPVAASLDDQVGPQKQHRIADAALKYLNTNHLESPPEVFFDIVSVVFDGQSADVKYIPGAWIPIYT